MTNTYSVLNTIALLGADLTLVGRKLNVAITALTGSGTFPTIDYLFINDEVTIPANVEVLQIQHITYVPVNSRTYKFVITQLIGGNVISTPFTYTSDSSATDAEISGALVAQINLQTQLGITASALPNTVVLTAKTGSPVFTVQPVANVLTLLILAGEFAVGIGADLVADGITGIISGNNYTQYVFTYAQAAGVQMATETQNGGNVHILYVNENVPQFVAFNIKMGEYMNAYVAGTTDANPEAVSVS